MKKIFTAEFFAQILLQIILSGIIIFFFQEYIKDKYAGQTAETILKKQNFLNDKRDAYFEALKIVNKELVNSDLTTPDGKLIDTTNRKRGTDYPTEMETNYAFSKLYLYCSDTTVLSKYKEIFNSENPRPVLSLIQFTNAIRKDLNESGDTINENMYKVIEIRREK